MKKRRPNFTKEEILAIVYGVIERKNLILGKFDTNVTAKVKAIQWQAITDSVNIVSPVRRNFEEVRKKFKDIRTHVKKKAAEDRRHTGGTGESI